MKPREALERLDTPGEGVGCTVCGRMKKPNGRSAPLEVANGLCDQDCEGYRKDPWPPQLWPGERPSEFGFACGTAVDADAIAILRDLIAKAEAVAASGHLDIDERLDYVEVQVPRRDWLAFVKLMRGDEPTTEDPE